MREKAIAIVTPGMWFDMYCFIFDIFILAFSLLSSLQVLSHSLYLIDQHLMQECGKLCQCVLGQTAQVVPRDLSDRLLGALVTSLA